MDARLGDAIIGRDHPAGLLRAEMDRGRPPATAAWSWSPASRASARRPWSRRRPARPGSAARWCSAPPAGIPTARPATGRGCRCCAACGAPPTTGPWRGSRPSRASRPCSASRHRRRAGRRRRGPASTGGRRRPEAFALYDAVTAALVAVSQHRPVVVVLDDLHWADPASLRLLEFAAQHTWFERLLLVGTYRDAEVESAEHPLRPLLMPLVAKATTITLTGLDPRRGGRADDPHRRPGARRRPGRRGAPAHRRQPVLRRADRPAVARRRRGRHDRARRTGGGAPPAGPAARRRGRGAHRRRRAGSGVPPAGRSRPARPPRRRRSTGCSTGR